jgi:hypothetical protein
VSDPLTDELVRFFLLQPTALARALMEHQPDPRGACRVCVSGAQRGNLVWPCITYLAATRAADEARKNIRNFPTVIQLPRGSAP